MQRHQLEQQLQNLHELSYKVDMLRRDNISLRKKINFTSVVLFLVVVTIAYLFYNTHDSHQHQQCNCTCAVHEVNQTGNNLVNPIPTPTATAATKYCIPECIDSPCRKQKCENGHCKDTYVCTANSSNCEECQEGENGSCNAVYTCIPTRTCMEAFCENGVCYKVPNHKKCPRNGVCALDGNSDPITGCLISVVVFILCDYNRQVLEVGGALSEHQIEHMLVQLKKFFETKLIIQSFNVKYEIATSSETIKKNPTENSCLVINILIGNLARLQIPPTFNEMLKSMFL